MNELKRLRKQAGLTQVEAAKLIGISRRSYQYKEEDDNYIEEREVLLNMLKEIWVDEDHPPLLPLKFIKSKCSEIFANYKEVRCAYLFGSYARGNATVDSDVDIIIVSEPMGLKFYKLASELEEALGKKVDLLSHRQATNNEEFLANILQEGIKIWTKT